LQDQISYKKSLTAEACLKSIPQATVVAANNDRLAKTKGILSRNNHPCFYKWTFETCFDTINYLPQTNWRNTQRKLPIW